MSGRLRTQLVEQRLCVFEVGGVEAFGEPAVDRREQVERFGAATPVAAEPGEARGGAQFPEFGLLLSGNAQATPVASGEALLRRGQISIYIAGGPDKREPIIRRPPTVNGNLVTVAGSHTPSRANRSSANSSVRVTRNAFLPNSIISSRPWSSFDDAPSPDDAPFIAASIIAEWIAILSLSAAI